MFKYLFLFFNILFVFFYSFTANAGQTADCNFTVSNGWTQTINYQCKSDINLKGATLRFTVDNPNGLINLKSVWGFINLSRYPINPQLILNGNNVSFVYDFDLSSVILSANTPTTISYSTNNNVKVTNIVLIPAGDNTNVGSLQFIKPTSSDDLPADTIIHIKGIDVKFSADLVFANQPTLDNIPYGTYQLSASGTVNGQSVAINVAPNQIILNSSVPQIISLTYKSTAAFLNILFPLAKPTDIGSESILVHVRDAVNIDNPVNVNWNGQTTLGGLTVGKTYKISADSINGQQNQYQFNFTPSSIKLVKGTNQVTIGMTSKPLPTGKINVTVTGLPPATATTLSFISKVDQSSINFNNIQNGISTFTLPAQSYTLSATSVFANGVRYSVNPQDINIIVSTTTSVSLLFNQTSVHGVNGWPNYLAMGAVTDDTPSTTISLQTRPVDAIFKYAGMGGNGDPGQIIYPIFTLQTADQAKTLTAFYQSQHLKNVVVPVMVVYTAQMSGGTSFTDFEYDNLVKHYISLLMEAQKLQSYQSNLNPYPGSIILNPDLFGMIQQQNLLTPLNNAISSVSLQKALKTAICFITHTINTQYGQNLNYEMLFTKIRAQSTDNWSAMSIWDTYKMQYFNECTANPVIPNNIVIPNFNNDFPSWVQSTNWLLKQFAPNVTFGWQENLWNVGSANWVHNNYDANSLKTKVSDPTLAMLKVISAYDGSYRPDFFVFDKYEMDAIPSATGIGYLFNARDLSNLLLYVKQVSEGLSNIPIMLWQIPGGHLQIKNDIDTRINHASTEPDFFFADSSNPIPNLQTYILNLQLPSSIYGTTSISNYLSMSEAGTNGVYNWQSNHLQLAADSHVFAILWGGGNTTSVGTFPSDDHGWLANKIINYYKNPTPISLH